MYTAKKKGFSTRTCIASKASTILKRWAWKICSRNRASPFWNGPSAFRSSRRGHKCASGLSTLAATSAALPSGSFFGVGASLAKSDGKSGYKVSVRSSSKDCGKITCSKSAEIHAPPVSTRANLDGERKQVRAGRGIAWQITVFRKLCRVHRISVANHRGELGDFQI